MSFISTCLRIIWRTRDGWLLLMLLAMSLGANVYQALRAHRLPVVSIPTRGMKAPILYAETMDGAKVEVDCAANGKPTLLFVFSPSCIWCKRNAKNMDALASMLKTDYRIVGLSTTSEGLKEYLRKYKINYEVYTNPDPDKSRVFILSGTPTTFVVSSNGIIKETWRGAYVGKMKEDIEASMGIKLPGIIPSDLETVHVQ